jgi:hypothetical protein
MAMAARLQYVPAMTRFDRFWEPFAFVLAFAIVWFGTL